ncbi:MAG: hypothetical protein JXA73_22410 [Acidobacteria bacterium]|nr:hypothetical protein [Acidobacteriota bacterium]
MRLLVRKIEAAKWRQNDIINGAEVSADAITGSLKTASNSLSVWMIESESALNDAVLAFVAEGQHVESMDFAYFDQSALEAVGLQIVNSLGRTPIEDMKQSHRDIVALTYRSLGLMANIIVDCFRTEKTRRFTKLALQNLLREAIQNKRLNPLELNPKIREDISLI